MNKLFGYEYVQGYTAALQDVLKVFEAIQVDLKLHKRKQNYKTYKAIIDCMLKNRVILREEPDSFIRCNNDVGGGFEVWGNKNMTKCFISDDCFLNGCYRYSCCNFDCKRPEIK